MGHVIFKLHYNQISQLKTNQAYGGREITKTGVSIQPKGTFKLDSKISLGSYNNSDTPKNGDLETSGVTSKSSYSSYSMTSSSSRSLFK